MRRRDALRALPLLVLALPALAAEPKVRVTLIRWPYT